MGRKTGSKKGTGQASDQVNKRSPRRRKHKEGGGKNKKLKKKKKENRTDLVRAPRDQGCRQLDKKKMKRRQKKKENPRKKKKEI